MEIRRTGKSYKFSELTLFLEGDDVECIHVLPNNCLMLGVARNPEIKVLDLG